MAESFLCTLKFMPHIADNPAVFTEDMHGLPCLPLTEGSARARLSRQGAQVLSWQGADGKERLYLSPNTGGMKRGDNAEMPAQSIRGGIPVCFPQFSDRGNLIKHGFVRNKPWSVALDAHPADSGQNKSALLLIDDDDKTRALWPHRFHAELQVSLQADSLVTSFSVTNTGDIPWQFTAALHTYLKVDDILHVKLKGLRGVRYQDATAANAESIQQEDELHVAHEVDRVYLSPPKILQLLENNRPALQIEQRGFEDTVVWNPGPIKARELSDFPDEDWLRMLCVEAACIDKPVVLQPGQQWSGSQILTLA